MAWIELNSRLSNLLAGFSALISNPNTAARLVVDADEFKRLAYNNVTAGGVRDTGSSSACCRNASRGGEVLAAFDARFRQRQRQPEAALAAARQTTAGCSLAAGCGAVATACCMPPADRAKLCGCVLQFLLGSGCRLFPSVVASLKDQQAGAAGLIAASEAADMIAAQLRCAQVFLSSNFVGPHPEQRIPLLAAMVPPEQLCEYMAGMVEAVDCLKPLVARGWLQAAVMPHLAAICSTVCNTDAFQPHQDALQRHPTVPASMIKLLLPALVAESVALQLPPASRPEHSSWNSARHMAGAMSSGVLAAALEQSPAAAATLLQHAALLVQHVPLEAPASVSPDTYPELLVAMVHLLGCTCGFFKATADAGGPQQLRQARQLLPAVARLPDMLQALLCWPGSDGVHAAHLCCTWIFQADLLVRLSDAVDGGGTMPVPDGVRGAVNLLQLTEWCRTGTAALRAVPALAQLLGLLLEQQPAGRVAPGLLMAVSQLQSQALNVAVRVAVACMRLVRVAEVAQLPAGDTSALELALWQLHSAACRLVHWVAAGGGDEDGGGDAGGVRGAFVRQLRRQPLVLTPLLCLTLVAVRLLRLQIDGAIAEERPDAHGVALLLPASPLQAMCTAHWAAVQVVLSGCTPAQLAAGREECGDVANGLAVVVGRGPEALAADPELLGMLGRMLGHLPQEAGLRVALYVQLLLSAQHGPRLAAHLMLTGQLADMVRDVQECVADGRLPVSEGRLFMPAVRNAAEALRLAAEDLRQAAAAAPPAGSSGSGGSGGGGAASTTPASSLAATAASGGNSSDSATGGMQEDRPLLAAIAQHLAAQATAMQSMHSLARPASIDALLQWLLGELLPAARQLATALQQYWQRPWRQVDSDQLELAQAAAARSCGYLRCANLGGSQGGPAAGEGAGSLRCSACRAVWYCGTACSHADWRAGGHKRVCKALAAARQQQRLAAAASS